MFWTIMIVGVLGYILFSFFKERENMLKSQVDLKGGMAKKYQYLISEMTGNGNARVEKVTRDHIQIRSVSRNSITDYYISESFNSVEIRWVAQMSLMGIHKHQWTFPDNYPQDKMIQEIEEFMEWKSKQMFGDV